MIAAADTLIRFDSLKRAAEQLFVQGAHWEPLQSADTAARALPTAADLYGSGSVLAQAAPAASDAGFAPDIVVQAFVLLLGVLYLLLLSNHLGNVYTLFVHSVSGSNAGHRSHDIRGGSNYTPFLNLSVVVGLLFSGILCLKIVSPQPPEASYPQLALCFAATAAFAAVLSLQTLLLKVAGAVTLTQEFLTELRGVKRSSLALLSILLPPVLLCYALAPAGCGDGWIYVILAETAIVLFLFLKASFALFAAKKVSIFHWFLYLCTVEVFPVSLLWLLIARR